MGCRGGSREAVPPCKHPSLHPLSHGSPKSKARMGGYRGETLPSPGPVPPGLAPSTLPDEGCLKGTVLIVLVLGFTQVLALAGGFVFVLLVLAQTHLGPRLPACAPGTLPAKPAE